MGKTHEEKMNKLILVAVLAFAVFAAGSELQELSNTDVDTANLAPAEKATDVAETSDDVGEGQFGGTFDGALVTTGSFSMMSAGGFERRQELALGDRRGGGFPQPERVGEVETAKQ